VLTLQSFTNNENQHDEKKHSKPMAKRESFFRELNQMRDEVNLYVNDIQKQILAIRPKNTNAEDFQEKAQSYVTLVQLTTDLLKKITQLFEEIFDQLTQYINDLWIHMNNHDQNQIHRVTRQFNEFLEQKISTSNKLFIDIQEILENIDDTESNWKQ